MTTHTAPHAIVIGSGIGGSALTALLAQAGLRVTLLEKNRYLGGICAGYEKKGFQIDFGTHMFTRGERGALGKVLQRLHREGEIDFRRIDDIAEVRWEDKGRPGGYGTVPLPSHPARMPMFAARMIREMGLSPLEVVAATRMMTSILTMNDAEADEWLYRPVPAFVTQFTNNPRLTAMFTYMLGLYFIVEPAEMSAGEAIYCFKRMVLDNNLSYPKGGSKAIPLAYCRVAEDLDADIRTATAVKRILITDGRVTGVELADGSRIDADIVISTSSVRSTALQLCDPADLPASFVDYAKTVRGALTAVQAKFALDKKLVDSGCLIGGFSETQHLLHADNAMIASVMTDTFDGRVPEAMPFYCPVPTNFDPDLAPPGHQLITACGFAPTTDIGLNEPAVKWEEALVDALRRIVPGLEEHTLFIDRTSVSWLEHWTGKETGTAISTAQIPSQVGKNRPSVTTPVQGLYLAGDGAGGRGVGTELAADSAMECAETIVTDLRRAVPPSWTKPRHESPSLGSSLIHAFSG